MYDMYMLSTYMCAPGCHRGRAAEERTGGPVYTSGWYCAGRCAPLPRGWTYSPKVHKWKNIVMIISIDTVKNTLSYAFNVPAANLEASQWAGDWVCVFVCQGWPRSIWPGSQFSSGNFQSSRKVKWWPSKPHQHDWHVIFYLLVSMSLVCVCLYLALPMWIDAFQRYRWLPCYCPPAPVAH